MILKSRLATSRYQKSRICDLEVARFGDFEGIDLHESIPACFRSRHRRRCLRGAPPGASYPCPAAISVRAKAASLEGVDGRAGRPAAPSARASQAARESGRPRLLLVGLRTTKFRSGHHERFGRFTDFARLDPGCGLRRFGFAGGASSGWVFPGRVRGRITLIAEVSSRSLMWAA